MSKLYIPKGWRLLRHLERRRKGDMYQPDGPHMWHAILTSQIGVQYHSTSKYSHFPVIRRK